MSDSRKGKARSRQLSWLRVGPDEVPLSRRARDKWRVGGWARGVRGTLKEVSMDGKGTLKMFTRKKRELIKTPSISKKSQAGSPGPQSSAPSVSSTSLLLSVRVRVVSDGLQLDGADCAQRGVSGVTVRVCLLQCAEGEALLFLRACC